MQCIVVESVFLLQSVCNRNTWITAACLRLCWFQVNTSSRVCGVTWETRFSVGSMEPALGLSWPLRKIFLWTMMLFWRHGHAVFVFSCLLCCASSEYSMPSILRSQDIWLWSVDISAFRYEQSTHTHVCAHKAQRLFFSFRNNTIQLQNKINTC